MYIYDRKNGYEGLKHFQAQNKHSCEDIAADI